MITVDSSKHQALNADPRATKQESISFLKNQKKLD